MYNSGVRLVSAYLDLVERAVITAAAVVFAVVDRTADVLVCKFASHIKNFLSNSKYGGCRDIIMSVI